MSEQYTQFDAPHPDPESDFRAKEPLHSLLMESPVDALEYLHNDLFDYQSEAQLDDDFPSVGLKRREFIQQLQYVMRLRKLTF